MLLAIMVDIFHSLSYASSEEVLCARKLSGGIHYCRLSIFLIIPTTTAIVNASPFSGAIFGTFTNLYNDGFSIRVTLPR